MTDNDFVGKYQNALSNLCGVDYPYMQGDPDVDALAELISLYIQQMHIINRKNAELDDLKRDDLPRCKDALRRANEIGIDLEKENKELSAEIEKLELLNAVLIESCNGYSKACDTYKAEIERLEAEIDKQYERAEANILGNMADGGTSCHWCIEHHRVNAIKEFADMLCEDRVSNDPVVIAAKCLVKEMVGDDNG